MRTGTALKGTNEETMEFDTKLSFEDSFWFKLSFVFIKHMNEI